MSLSDILFGSGKPAGFVDTRRLQGPTNFRNAASNYLIDTIKGDYLPYGGPGGMAATQALANEAVQPTLSLFSASGRGPGRSGLADAAIARAAAVPFAARYGEERALQQDAAQSGESLQTTFSEPYFEDKLSQILGALGLGGSLISGLTGGQGGGILDWIGKAIGLIPSGPEDILLKRGDTIAGGGLKLPFSIPIDSIPTSGLPGTGSYPGQYGSVTPVNPGTAPGRFPSTPPGTGSLIAKAAGAAGGGYTPAAPGVIGSVKGPPVLNYASGQTGLSAGSAPGQGALNAVGGLPGATIGGLGLLIASGLIPGIGGIPKTLSGNPGGDQFRLPAGVYGFSPGDGRLSNSITTGTPGQIEKFTQRGLETTADLRKIGVDPKQVAGIVNQAGGIKTRNMGSVAQALKKKYGTRRANSILQAITRSPNATVDFFVKSTPLSATERVAARGGIR